MFYFLTSYFNKIHTINGDFIIFFNFIHRYFHSFGQFYDRLKNHNVAQYGNLCNKNCFLNLYTMCVKRNFWKKSYILIHFSIIRHFDKCTVNYTVSYDFQQYS